MIRKINVIYCDGDHGIGDQTFPELDHLRPEDFERTDSVRTIRNEAKKVGWSHSRDGRDWCPYCTESGARP